MLVVDGYAVHDAIEEVIGPDVVVSAYAVCFVHGRNVNGFGNEVPTRVVKVFLLKSGADKFCKLCSDWLVGNRLDLRLHDSGDLGDIYVCGNMMVSYPSGQYLVNQMATSYGSGIPNQPLSGVSPIPEHWTGHSGEDRPSDEYSRMMNLRNPYDPDFRWSNIVVSYKVIEVSLEV